MIDSGSSPAPRRFQRKTIVLVGGGCLVIVLAVVQMLLLVFWQSRQMGAETEKRLRPFSTPPSWIPVYPGTHPTIERTIFQGEGQVAVHTPDPAERAIDFYADRLRTEGFEVERLPGTSQDFRLQGRRPDGCGITVRASQSPGRTWIAVKFQLPGKLGL